jgi:hypothetical protein
MHVVEVRAENGAVDNDEQPLASTTTSTVFMPPAPVAPGAVSGLRVVPDVAHRQVTLTWAAPADDGGAMITEYLLTVGATTYTTSGTSLTVSVPIGATYWVTVAARNAAGVGAPTATTAVLTTVPAAPKIGASKAGRKGGATTAVFGWSAPAATGGSAIKGYEVTVITLKKGKKASAKAYAVGASARSFEIKLAVKKGVTYAAVVRAKNALGWSPRSAQSKAVTPR